MRDKRLFAGLTAIVAFVVAASPLTVEATTVHTPPLGRGLERPNVVLC